MAIINRDLDNTQKREVVQHSFQAAFNTGVTAVLGVVPANSLVMSFFGGAFGLSNAPQYSLSLYRFVGGFTAIGCGATLVPGAFGTSGIVSASLVTGVTALRGDLLVVLSGVADTAALRSVFGAVLQPTEDYKKYLGT